MLYKWCVLCIPIGSSVEKDALLLSLGTSTHPRREKKERGAGTLWADLSSTQNTSDFRDRKAHELKKWTTKSPQQISLICSLPVSCQTTELLPPPPAPQPGSQSAVVNQSNPINRRLAGKQVD
ncbi:Hypothetical predicted protein [Xyrichtys novacula]|uniref:Uncharacterized protein n=1 Tax=Xyrichtys novacula TaxID=13765 RepID=A0AAV1HH88_XYRNO|nr:Hypothetical predicted protein [Xyrichtys novacula]